MLRIFNVIFCIMAWDVVGARFVCFLNFYLILFYIYLYTSHIHMYTLLFF